MHVRAVLRLMDMCQLGLSPEDVKYMPVAGSIMLGSVDCAASFPVIEWKSLFIGILISNPGWFN